MEFVTTSSSVRTVLKCTSCGTEFASRNKLFKHVRTCVSTNEIATSQLAPFLTDNWVIFALGGRLRGRTLNSVERFSFKEQNWSAAKNMMDHRGSHTAVSYGKFIYVFGGGGFESNLSSCEKYSLDSGEWSAIAPMNSLRHAHSICRLDNRIFIVGGWIDGSRCIGDVEVYDTLSDSWSDAAALQTPRRLHASTAINGKLFVFGGNSANANHLTSDTTLQLDATGSSFFTSATAAENIPGLSAGSVSGSGTEWYTKKAERYDAASGSWVYIRDLPESGACSATALSLVTAGGVEKELVFVFMHGKYVLRYDVEADAYTRCAALPERNWYCFDVCMLKPAGAGAEEGRDQHRVHDGRIYCVGGAVDGSWSHVLYAYDVRADSWSKLPDMRLPRRRCCAVALQLSS